MTIPEILTSLSLVQEEYNRKFTVTHSPDWFLLKLQEELGEMTNAHLVRTQRTRRKVENPEETKAALAEEIADVISYALLFANSVDIDPEAAIVKKWFAYLPTHNVS